MNIGKLQVAQLCRTFGPRLALPAGIDGAQLLWAIAGTESSFGADSVPRHEPAYCFAGALFDKPASVAWGCWAHCSYGPWQVMFANAMPGISPTLFGTSPQLSAQAAVLFLQNMIRRQAPQSLAQLAEIYNKGHITPDPDYVAKIAANYDVPIVSQP